MAHYIFSPCCSPIPLREQFHPHTSHPLASEISPGLNRHDEILLCVAAAGCALLQPLDTFHLHLC